MGDESKPNTDFFQALEHHALYGQPGEPQTTRAVPPQDGWAKPFSKPELIAWRIALGSDSLRTLKLGFHGQEMEDKWDVYSTEPDSEGNMGVSTHRSWTGKRVIELRVQTSNESDGEGKGYVTALRWETDEELYPTGCEGDGKMTAREVCRWVLGFELGLEDKQSWINCLS